MAKKSHIQAEDLYRYELPREPRIAPDGRHVIFSQTRVERDTEKKYSNLWVMPTSGGKPRQFTVGNQSDSSPRWSPDGRQIAFLSNRGSKDDPAQIFLIPFDGGEARAITNIEGSIEWFKWSPDGKKLLCAVEKTDAEVLERKKDTKKKDLGTVFRHYKRVFYKMDGAGFHSQERTHLWVVNVRSGKAKQITDHEIYDERDATWSADGETIFLVSNRAKDPDFAPNQDTLYHLPAGGGKLTAIDETVGGKYFPSCSPDGKWVAYYGAQGTGDWWKNICLFVVPADGSAPPVNLTGRYDFNIGADTLNDAGGQELVPPIWSPDGERLFFTVERHGSTLLHSVNTAGEDLQVHQQGPGNVGSVSFDRSGKKAAFFWATMTDPGQVGVLDLATGESRLLTHLNAWLDSINLGNVEEVWFKGAAGNDLQGWILTPPGFDPKKKYPSILEIHGGPLAQYGHFFMHEFFLLAASGYVVYFSNPRGGQGYGEAHAKSIWGAWGTVDYDDLMVWADLISKKPYIDKKRMGVTGGSYGGYMTLWIIGQTHRFKAAVAQRVLSNFISMWGSSDFNWSFQQVINNLPPYQDVLNAWDRSPMKHIGNAKTPTLIIHSEQDHRTPIEQGEQAFVALKSLGVDAEFVRFPDSPHGLSRVGRTDRRIARLKHILRWFDTHL